MHRRTTHASQMKKGFMRLFILENLFIQPMHGYALMKRIWEKSGGFWTPRAGFIYPLLNEMVEEGLIEQTGREQRRKIYAITTAGKSELLQLHKEAEDSVIHLTEILSADDDPIRRHIQLLEQLPSSERAERMRSRLRALDTLISSLSRMKQDLERSVEEERRGGKQ